VIELRDYQNNNVEQIRSAYRAGAKSVLYVAPTGSGKTVLFAYVVAGARAKGHSVLILAHRAELIDQISSALNQFSVPHGIIAAGHPPRSLPVQVASVQTLIRRLSSCAAPDLIVQDEAHHLAAGNTWGRIHAAFPRARLLGVTATPVRLDGQGLARFFDTLIVGPSTQELIDRKFLAPLRVFAPVQPDLTGVHRRGGDYVTSELADVMAKPAIIGSALEQYVKHAAGQRAIVFSPSIEHARDTSRQFLAAGHSSQCIDGGMDRQLRTEAITAFRAGTIRVLTSCDLVSEGFDLPAIECAIALRPTQSLGLWLQQVGRILRPSPGKTHALLLDHAGNTLRHGLPTDARQWSLTDGIVSSAQRKASVRICARCFAAATARSLVCPECGEWFQVKPREVRELPGELHEIAGVRIERLPQAQLDTLEALIAEGKRRGYKSPLYWAKHVLAGRAAKRKLA
jgi:superfamily II DNA or RNA helicase